MFTRSATPLVTSVTFQQSEPGYRSLFMVEPNGPSDTRKVLSTIERLARVHRVEWLTDGPILAFAVRVSRADEMREVREVRDSLKPLSQMTLFENNFTKQSYLTLLELAATTRLNLNKLDECGICGDADPFPSRLTARLSDVAERTTRSYCLRCTALCADASISAHVRNLLGKDPMRLRLAPDARVVLEPAVRRRTRSRLVHVA